MAVYDDLEAKCLPLLEAYHNDLTGIDRDFIEANPGVPFLHWTRPTGTHMDFLPAADDPSYPPYGKCVPYLFGSATRDHILRQKLRMAEYHTNPVNGQFTCHYFNGKTLREVTCEQAVKLVKEYIRPIERKWHEEYLRNERPWEYRQLREDGLLVG